MIIFRTIKCSFYTYGVFLYPILSAGKGHVIRGWDEAIMKMTVGQTCGVYIESPWAYGKKGQPAAGIPPNQDLYFEVTLDRLG